MAIQLLSNGISIGSFILSESSDGTGLSFNGVARVGEKIAGNYGRYLGTVSGYTSGGDDPTPNSSVNVIDKFPFATDTSASDVGDLTQARSLIAGQSSTVSGYTSGGFLSPVPNPPNTNTIDKFPFATDANATDVGDLSQIRAGPVGQSSTVSGYSSGGYLLPPSPITRQTTIDKFPFAVDASATDVGDLTEARFSAAGQSSTASGYSSGGSAPSNSNVIDKFSFAANANATDVGDLSQNRQGAAGQSSAVSGYTSGGDLGPPAVTLNTIDKFPFAADSNASNVGDLSETRGGAGQSSSVSGYTSGGSEISTNVIDKFPFTTDTSASDVGDLTQARFNLAGQQV